MYRVSTREVAVCWTQIPVRPLGMLIPVVSSVWQNSSGAAAAAPGNSSAAATSGVRKKVRFRMLSSLLVVKLSTGRAVGVC